MPAPHYSSEPHRELEEVLLPGMLIHLQHTSTQLLGVTENLQVILFYGQVENQELVTRTQQIIA